MNSEQRKQAAADQARNERDGVVPEEDQLCNSYLTEEYKQYVRDHYLPTNESLLENKQILQMIYALEWYDIPRFAHNDLIQFHPYLTEGDYAKLMYANTDNYVENGIFFGLFTVISNRLLGARGPKLFQKRFLRFTGAFCSGALLTYAIQVAMLRQIYLGDLKELGLSDKYFQLDLDADMMRNDLQKLGFKIDARHFDKEEVQRRVEAAHEQQLKDKRDEQHKQL